MLLTIKRILVEASMSTFGKLFRMLPAGTIKAWVKGRLFDRYMGWRQTVLSTRTAFGSRMILHLPDVVQTHVFLTGVWERTTTEIVLDALRPGDVFVDVGANVGYFSLRAAPREPDAHVVAPGAAAVQPGAFRIGEVSGVRGPGLVGARSPDRAAGTGKFHDPAALSGLESVVVCVARATRRCIDLGHPKPSFVMPLPA